MRRIVPALAVLAGAIASHLLMRIAPSSIAVDRAQPLVVATNWHDFGLVTIVLLACTLLATQLVRIDGRRDALVASSLALAAGLFFTPVFSSDVYAYAAYGHMTNLGMNPYAHVTLPANDPLFAAAIWQWSNPLPICAYGPAFVLLAHLIDAAAHTLPLAVELNAFRVVASLGLLAAAALAGERRAAMLALNPVALWCAIEGHNDTLMLACVLAGVALARRNAFAGSALVALGGLVKIPALVAAAARGVEAIARKSNTTATTVAGSVAGIAVTLLASSAWIYGVTHGTIAHGHYAPQASFQALTFVLAGPAVGPVIAALCALALLVYAYRVWRDDATSGWAVAAMAAWLLIPNPYPWYGVWLLGIAVYARNPRVRFAILTLVGASLLRYVPDAVQTLGPAWNATLGAVATLPVLALWLPLRDSAILNRS